EGDDAGGAAVFVDHDRHLVAARAQLGDQHVQVHGLGHAQRLGAEGADGHLHALLARHGDGRFDVHDAGDVIQVVVVDGKPTVAGAACQADDVVGGVAHGDGVHARTRCHDVV